MDTVVLVLDTAGIFGIATLVVVWLRGFYGNYSIYAVPMNFWIGTYMFAEAIRTTNFFRWLFLFAYSALVAALAMLLPLLQKKPLAPTARWFFAAVPGALCAVTARAIPVDVSLALAVLAILAGFVCTVIWFLGLPPRSSRISST